jgi:FkbM family methyltransferase
MADRKSQFEQNARQRLLGSRLFPVVRTAYQSLFNRGKLENRRQMREFYSQFIRPDDLVFDVGANVGIYAEIFTELGAHVVAIEPNPECIRLLRELGRRSRLSVEPLAVSDSPGTLMLQLSDKSQLSSANPEWRREVEESALHRGAHWKEQIQVEAVTLDQLALRHGIPRLVKIDVEGFDDRVIRGMSFKPAALTFEFNRILPAVAISCLAAPALADGYEFNFIKGGEEPSGDVIARLLEAPRK